MILRRFMRHITDQNWFAVGLDVIVVIVGIFLGLQVQAWYNERNDRIIEQEYLERLLDDVELSVKLQKNEVDTANNHLNEILNAIEILEADSPNDAEKKMLPSLMTNVGIMRPLRMVSGTIDELTSSGNLSLVQDVNLRKELYALKAYFERNQSVLRLVHERNLSKLQIIDVLLNAKYSPELDQNYTRYEFIFEDLKTNAEFMNMLHFNSTVHAGYLGFHQRTLETTISFRNVLTKNLEENFP